MPRGNFLYFGLCVGFVTGSLLPVSAVARSAAIPGYVVNSTGKVVTSGSGECVRTGEWSPALAIEQCDPSLVRREGVRLQSYAGERMPPPGAQGAPLPEAVSFTVEALFDFNQDVLNADGKAVLDQLAQKLGSTDYDVVVATGHADRLGSEQYNEQLSQRRSEAVKAYLVSKGVPAERIQTQALGELNPATRPGDCSGPRAQLIECLQPDRRVDVEATGRQPRTAQQTR